MSDTQSKLNEIEDKIETLEDSLSGIRKVTPLHDICLLYTSDAADDA